MKVKKITSRKTGRKGWLYRYTSPLTHRETEKRIYVSERAIADKLLQKHLSNLELQAAGVPSGDGWKLPYDTLVQRFLSEAPITSAKRKADLRRALERNPLGLESARDFNDIGALNAKCRRLFEAKAYTAHYLSGYVQRVLQQVSRWCFDAGLLPTHPLSRWRKLPFNCEHRKRGAYTDDEVRAILATMRDLDRIFGRQYPLEVVLRTLVTCGNRPGVMLRAKVADLEPDRVKLSPGEGKKRNGAAMLPPELVQELRIYTRNRAADAPLFVSADGAPLDEANLCKRDFRMAVTLAVVREAWPNTNPDTRYAEPLEVASAIMAGGSFRFDGRVPQDRAKVQARETRKTAIVALAGKLAPLVSAKLARRDLYAFTRKTHITLARSHGVHPDAVNAQVGHSDGTAEEKFYLDGDQLSPSASSRMVYSLICPKAAEAASNVLRLAAGAEGQGAAESQVDSQVDDKKRRRAASGAARTPILIFYSLGAVDSISHCRVRIGLRARP